MIWKCIDSPKRKKFKAVDCVHKIMATNVSDARDVLLDFLSRGETVIAGWAEGSRKTEKKWPCWLNLGAIIIHDNVTYYMAWITRQWFRWYEWEVLQHPPQIGQQGAWNVVGLSKGLWPGSGSRKIVVLL
jgi:hypothetical protein